jgi:hypothetical protein
MSLTTTAYEARLVIKYGGIVVVMMAIMYSVVGMAIAAYKAAHPPYTPPTVRFGKLPKTVFPEKKFDKKTFSRELPNDSFPKFSDQARVYVLYRPSSSLLAIDYYTQMAKGLGFLQEPTKLNETIYEFKNDQLNQSLKMNVLDGSFVMSYPYSNDQLIFAQEKVPSKEEAINIAKNYLETAGKMKPDLENGKKAVSYWKIESDGLKAAPAQSEANVARVDFFRDNLEGDFKMVGTELNRASISMLVSGSTVEGKKILEVNYKYADMARDSYSTYPIKSPETAWAELQAGKYWPVSDTTNSKVGIREMSLAYFEPVTLTNYLQPVYVFAGDGNFVAYVPAVANELVQN